MNRRWFSPSKKGLLKERNKNNHAEKYRSHQEISSSGSYRKRKAIHREAQFPDVPALQAQPISSSRTLGNEKGRIFHHTGVPKFPVEEGRDYAPYPHEPDADI